MDFFFTTHVFKRAIKSFEKMYTFYKSKNTLLAIHVCQLRNERLPIYLLVCAVHVLFILYISMSTRKFIDITKRRF